MTIEALFAQATTGFGGILTDVFTVLSACVSILIILAGGRILYAIITHQSVIPEKDGQDRYDESENESNGILESQERLKQ